MAGTNFNIPALGKDNYDTWKIQMRALLIQKKLWKYADGSSAKPTEDSAERVITKWIEEDQLAMTSIILAMAPSELKNVKHCETTRETWLKLESIYASKTPARKATLMKALFTRRLEDGQDVHKYVDDFFEAVDKLKAMDIDINDDLLTTMALQGLPPSFEMFRCTIESRDELPTPEELKIKILNECLTERGNNSKADESQAYWTHSRSGQRWQRGHSDKKFHNDGNCYKCGEPGHIAKYCPASSGGEAPRDDVSTVTDFYIEAQSYEETNKVQSRVKKKWCLDSGCTAHLCGDYRMLKDEEKCDTVLELATDASTKASVKGVVSVAVSGGRCQVINLHDTMYVPKLRTNLMSVAKIVDKGYTVIFKHNLAMVKGHDGNVLMVADRVGDLYYVREGTAESAAEVDETGSVQACAGHTLVVNGAGRAQAVKAERTQAVTRAGTGAPASLWHRRLGHIHIDGVNRLFQQKLATGIKLSAPGKFTVCDVCCRGKQAVIPYKERVDRSRVPLEIVHTDVCGPIKGDSHEEARYMVSFVDDHSMWCEVYFMKNKGEILDKFKEYKNVVETFTGRRIKYLQCGNGREYCDETLDEFLGREGVQKILSTPCMQEQDGVAERKNQTLLDAARCMLIEAGLPQSYWVEAVAATNYLRNRCPSKCIGGKTPYEVWYKKVPDLRHVRIFGSTAHVLDEDIGRGKFNPRMNTGRLVGYDQQAKAYRVRLDSGKVVVTRKVTFDENFKAKRTVKNPLEVERWGRVPGREPVTTPSKTSNKIENADEWKRAAADRNVFRTEVVLRNNLIKGSTNEHKKARTSARWLKSKPGSSATDELMNRDDRGAQAQAENPMHHPWTKYMDVRCHFTCMRSSRKTHSRGAFTYGQNGGRRTQERLLPNQSIFTGTTWDCHKAENAVIEGGCWKYRQ